MFTQKQYYSDLVKKNLKSLIEHCTEKNEIQLVQHEAEINFFKDFSELCKEKKKAIWEHLDDPPIVNDINNKWEDQPMFTIELTHFKPLTEGEVKAIVPKSPLTEGEVKSIMLKITKQILWTWSNSSNSFTHSLKRPSWGGGDPIRS